MFHMEIFVFGDIHPSQTIKINNPIVMEEVDEEVVVVLLVITVEGVRYERGGFENTVMDPETGTKNTATNPSSQNSKP